VGELLMTTFDEREKAFEKKFAIDEELRFKATVRRNKLLALWAAEKMGMNASEAEAYARDVIKSNVEAHGDENLTRKILADFAAKKIGQSEHQVRCALTELLALARKQIAGESEKARL
jgi:hypothetical protein